MGINAIKCKGMYAETGKAGFGGGTKSASDFDCEDLLSTKAGVILGTTLAGVLLYISTLPMGETKTYLFNKNCSEPEKPAITPDAPQVTQSHYTEFSFNKHGESDLVRGEFTNNSYRIDFDRIEHQQVIYGLFDHVAHLNITDIDTSETKSLAIRNSASIDIDMHHSASIDVGHEYATITIKET